MAKSVKLLQKFGAHRPGETVQVDDTTADWLVGISRGTTTQEPAPQNKGRVHPGTDGADPVAGGDPTRHYGLVTHKAERSHNQALPVPGSPVQYNAGVRSDDGHHSGRPEAKRQAQANRDAGRPTEGPSSEDRKATTARKASDSSSAGKSSRKEPARTSDGQQLDASKAATSQQGKRRPGES
jgi:hypothetical protein